MNITQEELETGFPRLHWQKHTHIFQLIKRIVNRNIFVLIHIIIFLSFADNICIDFDNLIYTFFFFFWCWRTGVTVLLSLTFFLNMVCETMPPASELPLIGIIKNKSLLFFFVLLLLLFLLLLLLQLWLLILFAHIYGFVLGWQGCNNLGDFN